MALEEFLQKPPCTLRTRGGHPCRLYGACPIPDRHPIPNHPGLGQDGPCFLRLGKSFQEKVWIVTHSSDSRDPGYPLQVYDWNLQADFRNFGERTHYAPG